jgi:hypothetical protein
LKYTTPTVENGCIIHMLLQIKDLKKQVSGPIPIRPGTIPNFIHIQQDF